MSIQFSSPAGRTTRSAESRRIRREDRIPAVVYGQGMEPPASPLTAEICVHSQEQRA